MSGKAILISAVAVALSFVGGFLLANAINRGEVQNMRAELERLKADQQKSATDAANTSLSTEEIRQRIDEADRNPTDAAFQKKLGLALSRYASMKQDMELLDKSIRLLDRAVALGPSDFDLQVGLGNAHFDVGYFKKDNEAFARSREFYRKALEQRPDNVEVRTDLGLTYFLQQPPDLAGAISEFERSLRINPNHEKALQFIIQSQIKQNEGAKAAQYLERLKAVNPKNPAIGELSTLLAQSNAETAQ